MLGAFHVRTTADKPQLTEVRTKWAPNHGKKNRPQCYLRGRFSLLGQLVAIGLSVHPDTINEDLDDILARSKVNGSHQVARG